MSHGGVDKQAATMKICLACNRQFQGQSISACPDDGISLIALKTEDEFLGRTLANSYHVTERIGQGGMGVVYKANHQMLDRIVAIKMLQTELVADEMSVRRFNQEAKAASCLNHPHIITLFDFGVLPAGQPYLVMEYLPGNALIDEIKQRGPMDPLRVTKIFSEVADGLYHAHTQGIVHRDLKPSNIILIERDGDKDFVKIVDFGLAKLMPWSGKESQHLTKTGEVFGSPIYMSPEQCMGKALGPTSDIYSLGITLFEALVGKPPFRGSNSIQTASKHMSENPPRFAEMNPSVALSENLERVVAKTLQKQPEDRFQNMAEFKDALQAAVYNDQAIEIPASLLVSRHAVPALNSSASIPALKSSSGLSAIRSSAAVPALRDQSETRLLTEFRPQAAQGGNKVLTMGLIAAGVLALGGTGAWLVMGQQANTIVKARGTISAIIKDDGFLEICSNRTPIRLNVSDPSLLTKLSDNENHSDIGKMATIKFKAKSASSTEGELQSITIDDAPTPQHKALLTVTEFMYKISQGNNPDELKRALQFCDNVSEATLKSVFSQLQHSPPGKTAASSRSAAAERMVRDETDAVTIEVFQKAYTEDAAPEAVWSFTLNPKKPVLDNGTDSGYVTITNVEAGTATVM